MVKVWRALEIILGVTFVAAAVLKALDMRAFAVQITYYGVLKDPVLVHSAAYISLAVETLLGALLIAGWRLRGWTYATTNLMLLGFTALIAYAAAYRGLTDCGCFGKYVPMSPLASIAKNIAMLAVASGLWWARGRLDVAARPGVGGMRVAALALSALVVAAGLGFGAMQGSPASPAEPVHADPDRPFARFVFDADTGRVDLGKGNYVVAVLSATCEHCMGSIPDANTLAGAHAQTGVQVVGLIMGKEDEIAQFRAVTATEFPLFPIEVETFFALITREPPRYILVRDGKEVTGWEGHAPSGQELADALAGKSSPAQTTP